MAVAANYDAILSRVWGFQGLRPLQQQAVDLTLAGRDALIVMPTGGGKSLCFQLPPLVDDGLTLVVSPLISLMTDQVQGLRLVGYPAEMMHSGLSAKDAEIAAARIQSGESKLVYVSPERVLTNAFVSLLALANQGRGVARVAIDEAHCISAWGHDFRPEYRVLSRLRDIFPQAPITALTATATPQVREDIARQLHLRDPEFLIGDFDRPNLNYRVVPKLDPYRQVAEVVGKYPHDAAIVYCISRKDTEQMASALVGLGLKAKAYHAGLDNETRKQISEDFAMDRLNVVVATVAFGMGIDRSNVRCVVHASLPKSIEGYQQETGRAGRDGLPSECVMLFGHGDVTRWMQVIRGSDPEHYQHQVRLIDEVKRFATAARCRHAMLVEYFGQSYTGETPCGACDVCQSPPSDVVDSTKYAQKILVTIRDAELKSGGYAFGLNHHIGVMRGANRESIRRQGHQELKGFGCMKDITAARLGSWIQQLQDQGLLVGTGGARPTISLSEEGANALRERREIPLYDSAAVSVEEIVLSPDDPLFEVLRSWRRATAESAGVPPYMVFGDATLKALAAQRPSRRETLLQVSGVGEKKADEFGPDLLNVLASYCQANELAMDLAATAVVKKNVLASGKLGPAASALRVLFESGASVDECVRQSSYARSTIAGHLGDWIAETKPASIRPWVDEPTEQRIRAAIDSVEHEGRLRPIFEALNEDVPYDLIRIVLKSL